MSPRATIGRPPGRTSYDGDAEVRLGFFTDTTLCIGCKACEVACKEWNGVPEDGFNWTGHSYDNTGSLSANSWRHVAFVEQDKVLRAGDEPIDTTSSTSGMRWLMSSDVCKHCTNAACLDVCPTGSLFRTEFGTVVVQQDICNGCGYCVPACPFGVIDKREIEGARATASRRNARSATTAPKMASNLRVPKPARPTRFSSAS